MAWGSGIEPGSTGSVVLKCILDCQEMFSGFTTHRTVSLPSGSCPLVNHSSCTPSPYHLILVSAMQSLTVRMADMGSVVPWLHVQQQIVLKFQLTEEPVCCSSATPHHLLVSVSHSSPPSASYHNNQQGSPTPFIIQLRDWHHRTVRQMSESKARRQILGMRISFMGEKSHVYEWHISKCALRSYQYQPKPVLFYVFLSKQVHTVYLCKIYRNLALGCCYNRIAI